ncbi:YcnI family protein [Protaetiibacter sp. SSC-01]|uniref:YcnI family copper-binding membrane protein n=1 Tax=Protaetiibacter sp. SSC-01 TaxID=2759943 RepID=UPI00165736EB|nr:YcnI family protein [Protaetiibacter sp. SSC-01]QNO36758.1 YcnI family protein [Protaetiibacter sp. SSC-01]
MSSITRRTTAASLAVAAATALALASPLAASAHVTFDENTAEAGSYALLTLKAPNESETAATVSLTLTLPADTPFTSVRTVPVAGWTAELVRETLPEPVTVGDGTITEAVTRIVWTADAGAGLRDGELGLFPVSLGPVPDTGSIVLPVDQGYSDGSVVSWADTEDGADHPAPVLYVNDAPASDHHGGSDDHATPEVTSAPDADAPADGSAAQVDVLARVLGIAGLAVGAVGVVLALVWRRRAADAAVAPRAPRDGGDA